MSTMDGLAALFGYLHQDWADDYDNVWEAVSAFKRDEVVATIEDACRQLAELERAAPSENDLRDLIVVRMGSGYWPPGDGYTFGSWVRALSSALCT